MAHRPLVLALTFALTFALGCDDDGGPTQCEIEEAAYQCVIDAGCGEGGHPASIAMLECEASGASCAAESAAQTDEINAYGDCWQACAGETDEEYFAARAGYYCIASGDEAYMAALEAAGEDGYLARLLGGCDWQCGDPPL